MSLRSDCVLSIVGLFPDEIGPKQLTAADGVPGTFTKRIKAWVKDGAQGEFVYVAPPADLEALFRRLTVAPNETELAGWLDGIGVDDHETMTGFFAGLTQAREYVVNAWPKFSIDGPAGPTILPLAPDDAEEVASVFGVLDEPTRLLDEVDSWTLTVEQAAAFRACFPDLAGHLDETIDLALAELRAKRPDFELGAEREAVLRTIRGLPPEEPFVPVAPPPDAPQKFKIDPERDRTQAEVSSAPKARS